MSGREGRHVFLVTVEAESVGDAESLLADALPGAAVEYVGATVGA